MDKLNISVTRTIDSGVRPIELKCTPIYDCLFSNVAGLRSRALVNSVDYGTLDPGDYMPALEDDRESASSFTARNLRVVLGALPALQSQARGISLFLLSCPVSLVRRGTLAAEVTRLLRAADPKCAEAVCLSFAPELLRLPPKDLQSALLHIRSLGCKVAVEGFGRAFPAGMAAYVQFAGALDIQTLAVGVPAETVLRGLNDAQCAYYTPAPGLRTEGRSLYMEKELTDLLSERSVASLAGFN
ncbi:MAG: EAL domain-containing protein [Firmicutes bacterium]|nr:EAL domain-containing protein [Bacillota bacterium]